MTHIEHMAFLLGTPEKAWETVADLSNYSKWMTNFGRIVQNGEGEAKAGSSFEQQFKIVGKWNPVFKWQSTQVEAPKTLVFQSKGTGVTSAVLKISLEPVPTGTQLKISADLQYQAIMRPYAWLTLERYFLRRTMQTRLRRTVDAVKAIVEGRPSKVYA